MKNFLKILLIAIPASVITVAFAQNTPTEPTLTFDGTPLSIFAGDSTTLSWSTTNVDSCTGVGFVTGGETSGSFIVTPESDTSYSIESIREEASSQWGPPLNDGIEQQCSNDPSGTPLSGQCVPGEENIYFYNDGIRDITSCSDWYAGTLWRLVQICEEGDIQAIRLEDTVTISVAQTTIAPTANISVNPDSINEGESTSLNWSSTNAVSCSSNDFSTGGETSGTTNVSPTEDASYSVTCTGAGGSATADADVSVTSNPGPPPVTQVPTANLIALPVAITNGDASTLSWVSTDSDTCTGTGFSTGDAVVGTVNVSPTADTVYRVDCTGAGGTAFDTASVTVTNPPAGIVSASLTLNPVSIDQGDRSTLSWSSSNATTCSGTGFSTGNNTSGSIFVSPEATSTYTVTCVGTGGSDSDTETLTVENVPSVPSVDVSLSPDTINRGGGSTVSWTSTNVDSCTGSFFSGSRGVSGSEFVTPPIDTSYQVTCTGSNGSASDVETLTVVANGFADCVFNGVTVPHGSSVEAYFEESVPFGGTCLSEERVCNDGTLSGSYTHDSCTEGPASTADFVCSKDNASWAECAGVYTLVQNTDPIYTLADNTVENWYQCGLIDDVTASFSDVGTDNARVSFGFTGTALESQFHDVSLCLDSVDAPDVQKNIRLKLLDFVIIEE